MLRRSGRRSGRPRAIVGAMNSVSVASPPRPGWQAIVGALTWRRPVVAALLALIVAAALNPIFVVPFAVLLGRMMFIAALLLLVFSVAGAWQPARLRPWLLQGAGGRRDGAIRDASRLPAERRRQRRRPARAGRAGDGNRLHHLHRAAHRAAARARLALPRARRAGALGPARLRARAQHAREGSARCVR